MIEFAIALRMKNQTNISLLETNSQIDLELRVYEHPPKKKCPNGLENCSEINNKKKTIDN